MQFLNEIIPVMKLLWKILLLINDYSDNNGVQLYIVNKKESYEKNQ